MLPSCTAKHPRPHRIQLRLQPSSAGARLPIIMRCAALLCLLLPLPLAAQATDAAPSAPAQRPSGVTISVPVLVRDKKGAPATNVTKDDLTLSEDSAAQSIRTLGPASGQSLTFGLLIDTSTGQRGATAEEKAASADFINAIMKSPPNSAAAVKGFVVHFDREVELLQDLTPSSDKVLKGAALLDSPEPAAAGGDTSTSGFQSLLYDAIYLATDEITSKQTGRKVLVLFTNGMDRGSKESLRTAIDTAQRSGTIIYAVYVKGEEQKRDNNQQQRNGQGRQRGGLGYPGGGGGGWPGGGGGYPGGGYPGGGGYPNGGSQGGQRPQTQPLKVDGKRILADLVTPTGGRVFEMTKKENAAAIYTMIADDLAHQSHSYLHAGPSRRTARFSFLEDREQAQRYRG